MGPSISCGTSCFSEMSPFSGSSMLTCDEIWRSQLRFRFRSKRVSLLVNEDFGCVPCVCRNLMFG
jgi:hypothetical protein